ncbi:MAG TPA: extracellular solute-binding protein [Chloroflexota bacterium]|jgi:multiple sugar transport system substrate-binding protein|nr:extracellular solute-binding protein [Chloroflexota bacterium]
MNAQPRHRLSRRAVIAALGGTTTLLALAACLPENQPTPTAKPAAAPPPTKAEEKPSAPAAAKPSTSGAQPTKLVAWFTDRRTINLMTEQQAKPEFEGKNPGITVEVQFVPESEILQKARTTKAAGNAPDVISIDETFLDDMFRDKMLHPIPDQIINVNQEMGRRIGFLYRIPHGESDAKYYGLPNGMFGGAIYYNEELLAKHKFSVEQIPDTWEEFLRWAKDLTILKGDAVDQAGFAVFGSEGTLISEYRAQKGGFEAGTAFETKEKINLTRDIEVQGYEFALDIYRKWKVDDKAGVTYQQRFGTGKAVTMLAYTWNNGFITLQYPDIKFGTILTPRFEKKGPYGEHSPDVGFAVMTQKDANTEASWKLWRYLVGPDYQKRYAIPRGVQPSLKVLWKDPTFDGSDKKWNAVAKKNTPPNGVDGGFVTVELGQILGTAWGPIRDQGANVRETLAGVEKRANEYLKNRPQWSALTWADYKAHPEWQTPEG